MVTINAWNKLYKAKGYFLKYPDENLIRFMAGYFYEKPDRAKIKILDLGCGVGRNSIYLACEGFDVYAVDLSQEGVRLGSAKVREKAIPVKFCIANLSQLPFHDDFFDAVVDIEAIECNLYDETKAIFKEVKRVLKNKGMLFSKLVSVEDSSFKKGEKVEDYTLDNIKDSTFESLGVTHFFNSQQIKEIMQGWHSFELNKFILTEKNMQEQSVYYLLVAKK